MAVDRVEVVIEMPMRMNKDIEWLLGEPHYNHAVEHLTPQQMADTGIDFGPESTAQRITSEASNMIIRYQSDYHLEQGDSKLEIFVSLIEQSIMHGFKEVQGILEELNLFNDKVESRFDATQRQTQEEMRAIRMELGFGRTE